jgi:hypothetical protein
VAAACPLLLPLLPLPWLLLPLLLLLLLPPCRPPGCKVQEEGLRRKVLGGVC